MPRGDQRREPPASELTDRRQPYTDAPYPEPKSPPDDDLGARDVVEQSPAGEPVERDQPAVTET